MGVQVTAEEWYLMPLHKLWTSLDIQHYLTFHWVESVYLFCQLRKCDAKQPVVDIACNIGDDGTPSSPTLQILLQ
ncbi:MAG: hypothetical protein V7K35_10545 [Nostoc sp.]|uniref:hypothetical protein n=1 Tax=Nostoc sp. TaxID=1180 RepID=UPI002FF50014